MKQLVLVALACGLGLGCGDNEPVPKPQAVVWVPENAEVPAAAANRAPLPLCGVSTSNIASSLIACVVGANAHGGVAELVIDTTAGTTRAIQIVRVLGGGQVEVIYGTHPEGFPWLWEITRCDGIEAATGDGPGLMPGECDPLAEIR